MRTAALLLIVGLLTGCMLAVRTPPPPTATPTPVPTVTPVPKPEPNGWEALAPGLEQRMFHPGRSLFDQMWVLRIDPGRYTFRAHYRPGAPLTVTDWQAELPEAIAFVNANFFSPDHTILGLLVADGVSYGASYQGRGGTFQVQNGFPRVRSNIAEPYLGEFLEQAVQAFPMLTLDGQAVYQPAGTQERVSRRTVVAQDWQGRILLMVTPLTGLTLADLSDYLPETDMGIAHALNLDGGGSTLMRVQPPGAAPLSLPSFDPVPAVLAVYAR